ncbi:dihydrofolate reductase [Pseudovibrio sp. SPO723]|uniref:dihydrofolate reductase n=1 Tax=Nesiotobacter zosterae TaxID=392721 RepID=UPI0029C3782D|nr:dihydrofolate reductase [Pseudovibrio sp. SPO723]MDX5594063.1 dihydrofolate reductase [Pseudovibrio sp. SPO723]
MTAIAMISAVAENGVIGADNDMPWSISTDLKFFRKTTMGKPVIMGRRTLLSIGKPLPGRTNIVVTRDEGFAYEGVTIARSVDEAIDLGLQVAREKTLDEIMIIGGGQIYLAAMPQATRLYITRVHAKPEGDTHFPEIAEDMWALKERTPFERGEKDTASTSLEIYERHAS